MVGSRAAIGSGVRAAKDTEWCLRLRSHHAVERILALARRFNSERSVARALRARRGAGAESRAVAASGGVAIWRYLATRSDIFCPSPQVPCLKRIKAALFIFAGTLLTWRRVQADQVPELQAPAVPFCISSAECPR